MTIRKLAIAVAAAAATLSAVPAIAADLGYGLKDQPYDDPRYSDIYRHPAPPPPPRYAAPHVPPQVYHGPPPYTRQHEPPYRQEGRYDGRHEGRYSGDCLPRQAVRSRLERDGWVDFHDPEVAGNVVHIRARRPNGRMFDLTVDRCSGEVLGAEAVDHRAAEAPLAPMPPDWRYRERPYGRY